MATTKSVTTHVPNLLQPHPSLRGESGDRKQILVEILFHPDLRRVGEIHVAGPAGSDLRFLIGRDEPIFGQVGLEDPCISRRHLTVFWSAARSTFTVEPEARASLPVGLLDVLGQVRSGALAPGSLVTIGTHVVLRLLAHPLETGSNLGLVGHSEIMADLRSRIRRMARLQDTILVRGEPGTGKELVARAVHDSSGRNARAYVPVNCAALPEALIEAELFGHVRGAFTGAPAAREGLFAAARGGTIFLDEIGDMPMAAQTRLLRVLQEGKVRPVGANTEIDVEVSVVAATNRDLRADVAAGKFRADLLTRLAGLEIEVPTLRARRSDIWLLFATFFLRRAQEASSPLDRFVREVDTYEQPIPLAAMLDLLSHDWPGNVRELERYVAAVEALNDETGPFLAPPLSPPTSTKPAAPAPPTTGTESTRDEQRRPNASELARLFDEHDFVVLRVAEALGVSRPTVKRWAKELSINLPEDLSPEAIEDARGGAAGDLVEMARALRVSVRGLKRRMKELG